MLIHPLSPSLTFRRRFPTARVRLPFHPPKLITCLLTRGFFCFNTALRLLPDHLSLPLLSSNRSGIGHSPYFLFREKLSLI